MLNVNRSDNYPCSSYYCPRQNRETILVYTGAAPPNIPQVRRKAHARNSLLPLITVLQCFQERKAGEVSDTFNRIYRVLMDI